MLKPWSPLWWYLEVRPLARNWIIRWSLHYGIILGWPKSSSRFLRNIVWKTQTNFLANPIQTDSREIISVFTTWGGKLPSANQESSLAVYTEVEPTHHISSSHVLQGPEPAENEDISLLNFGTRDQFHGRQFFHRLRVGVRWFGDDSSTLHLLCILSLLLLYQLHLRSSGIRSLRLGTPVLKDLY